MGDGTSGGGFGSLPRTAGHTVGDSPGKRDKTKGLVVNTAGSKTIVSDFDTKTNKSERLANRSLTGTGDGDGCLGQAADIHHDWRARTRLQLNRECRVDLGASLHRNLEVLVNLAWFEHQLAALLSLVISWRFGGAV